ncbi:MAG: PspA/IM30 family protein [Verrucomicrobia bacterium]|nr:PspA/IM30 family protein [Verrucomicrobiota bacterium]
MLKRLYRLIRGSLGILLRSLEQQHPEALLDTERENLRKQIAQYNQGLAANAGLCERLITQVRTLERDEKALRAKTTALVRTGNRELAGSFAVRLQAVRQGLHQSRADLEQAEETYRQLIRARDVAIQNAQARIEALRSVLDDLKIKRATAELAEMASGLIIRTGGSGDTLARLQQMIEQERDTAAGKARLARDTLTAGNVMLQERERKALEEQALADFAVTEGITSETGIAPGGGVVAARTLKG